MVRNEQFHSQKNDSRKHPQTRQPSQECELLGSFHGAQSKRNKGHKFKQSLPKGLVKHHRDGVQTQSPRVPPSPAQPQAPSSFATLWSAPALGGDCVSQNFTRVESHGARSSCSGFLLQPYHSETILWLHLSRGLFL